MVLNLRQRWVGRGRHLKSPAVRMEKTGVIGNVLSVTMAMTRYFSVGFFHRLNSGVDVYFAAVKMSLPTMGISVFPRLSFLIFKTFSYANGRLVAPKACGK
jgi:hypothetical protein